MYKNKASDGSNNICGRKVKEIRLNLPEKISQRKLAEMLQIAGLDIDKNGIQRIENGARFVTDIEVKKIAEVLNVSYEELLDEWIYKHIKNNFTKESQLNALFFWHKIKK